MLHARVITIFLSKREATAQVADESSGWCVFRENCQRVRLDMRAP